MLVLFILRGITIGPREFNKIFERKKRKERKERKEKGWKGRKGGKGGKKSFFCLICTYCTCLDPRQCILFNENQHGFKDSPAQKTGGEKKAQKDSNPWPHE